MKEEYIKREDAIKAFCIDCKGQSEPCEHSDICKTMKVLRSRKKIPAVEPKHGEWIETDSPYIWKCSECPCEVVGNSLEQYNFCPNCGADMRGDKNNG